MATTSEKLTAVARFHKDEAHRVINEWLDKNRSADGYRKAFIHAITAIYDALPDDAKRLTP